MLKHFKDFKGDMSEDQVPATIYSLWHYYFHSSLLRGQTVQGETESNLKKDDAPFWTTVTRLSLIDNYAFTDFYQRMIIELSKNPKSTVYERVCYKGYRGD